MLQQTEALLGTQNYRFSTEQDLWSGSTQEINAYSYQKYYENHVSAHLVVVSTAPLFTPHLNEAQQSEDHNGRT